MFRLLHPYYATVSFLSWSLTQIKRMFLSLFYIFAFIQIAFQSKRKSSDPEVGHKRESTKTLQSKTSQFENIEFMKQSSNMKPTQETATATTRTLTLRHRMCTKCKQLSSWALSKMPIRR
jgi:hypothetical protein